MVRSVNRTANKCSFTRGLHKATTVTVHAEIEAFNKALKVSFIWHELAPHMLATRPAKSGGLTMIVMQSRARPTIRLSNEVAVCG